MIIQKNKEACSSGYSFKIPLAVSSHLLPFFYSSFTFDLMTFRLMTDFANFLYLCASLKTRNDFS